MLSFVAAGSHVMSFLTTPKNFKTDLCLQAMSKSPGWLGLARGPRALVWFRRRRQWEPVFGPELLLTWKAFSQKENKGESWG